MLADPLHIDAGGDIGGMLAIIGGGDPTPKRLRRGAYEINHFSFDHCLQHVLSFPRQVGEEFGYWLRYPDLGRSTLESDSFTLYEFDCFGVCDSPDQFFEHEIGKWIIDSEKKFVVSFSKVVKAEQSDSGGWRWHKWGPYIGAHEPQCEYIYDEGEEIQEVYCYHVYECLSDNAIAPIEEN